MKFFEKTITSKKIYNGNILSLFYDEVELENNVISSREYIKHPGAVCIVPIDQKSNVLMVKQYRYPLRKPVLEIPAGKLDKDEIPHIAAQRELQEETGYFSDKLTFIGNYYPSPAFLTELLYMYVAYDLKPLKQNLDKDEILKVESYHLDKLVDMIMTNQICDGKTQVAILKAKYLTDNNMI